MTLLLFVLFTFPILCWWGWFHHWKKSKALMKENESLKIELSGLSNIQKQSEQKTILATDKIQDIKLSYQLKENELRDQLARNEEKHSKLLEEFRTLKRLNFYFNKASTYIERVEQYYSTLSLLYNQSINFLLHLSSIEKSFSK